MSDFIIVCYNNYYCCLIKHLIKSCINPLRRSVQSSSDTIRNHTNSNISALPVWNINSLTCPHFFLSFNFLFKRNP